MRFELWYGRHDIKRDVFVGCGPDISGQCRIERYEGGGHIRGSQHLRPSEATWSKTMRQKVFEEEENGGGETLNKGVTAGVAVNIINSSSNFGRWTTS